MRKNIHSMTQPKRHNVAFRAIIIAVENFIHELTAEERGALLEEITIIANDASMTDEPGEARHPLPGHRHNGQRDHLLPLKAVQARVGLRKTTIYKMLKKEQFPQAVRIGRSVRWKTSDISQWIADRDHGGGGSD